MFNTQPARHTQASLLQFFKDSKGQTGVKFNATTGALSLVPLGAAATRIPRRSVDTLVEFHPAPCQAYECHVGIDKKADKETAHVNFRASLSPQLDDITEPVAIKYEPTNPSQQFVSTPLLPEQPIILIDDELEIDTANLQPKLKKQPFNTQKTLAFAYAEFEKWLEAALETIDQIRSKLPDDEQLDAKALETDEPDVHQVYMAVLNTGQPITESDTYRSWEQYAEKKPQIDAEIARKQREREIKEDSISISIYSRDSRYWQWRSAANGVAVTAALSMFMDGFGRGIDACFTNNYYTFPAFAIDGAAVSVAAILWPLALGSLFLYDYYHNAKISLERQLDRSLTDRELAYIHENTVKLGIKIFSGIVGMELGMHIASHVVKAIGQVALTAAGAINPVGHLVAALMVGLASALFIGLANICVAALHNFRHDWDKDLAKDTGKLMLVAFIAASLWYAISILDIIPGSELAITIANSVIKSLLSYLTIKCVFFDIYKLVDGKEVKDTPYSDAKNGAKQYNYMLTNALGSARDTAGAVLDKLSSGDQNLPISPQVPDWSPIHPDDPGPIQYRY